MRTEATGPLTGIRVLEIRALGQGRSRGVVLSDFGATWCATTGRRFRLVRRETSRLLGAWPEARGNRPQEPSGRRARYADGRAGSMCSSNQGPDRADERWHQAVWGLLTCAMLHAILPS